MAFTGFGDDALKFLGQLSRNNKKEWFDKNRSRYDESLLEPAKAFVVQMGDHLFSLSPDINAEPRINGSIRRINRDIRFSKDKKPYKDHFDLFFRYADASKEGPGYFVRMTPKSVFVGGGAYMFDSNRLTTYRDAVADDATGKPLAAVVQKLKKAGYSVNGEHYKRVPRGYDADHARGNLLRCWGLYAVTDLGNPDELTTHKFPSVCMKHFKKFSPLTEWIYENVNHG